MPYDQLVFLLGSLSTKCAALWPTEVSAWAGIFIADFVRGITPAGDFVYWMAQISADYGQLAECIVQ